MTVVRRSGGRGRRLTDHGIWTIGRPTFGEQRAGWGQVTAIRIQQVAPFVCEENFVERRLVLNFVEVREITHIDAHIGDYRLSGAIHRRDSCSVLGPGVQNHTREVVATAARGTIVAMEPDFVEAVFAHRDGQTVLGRPQEIPYDEVLRGCSEAVRRAVAMPDLYGRIYVESALTLSLQHLDGLERSRFRTPDGTGGLSSGVLRRVLDYVEAHLSDDVSLIDLAALAHLSPAHFGRAFKRSVGVSPYRFTLNRRLHEARERLSNGRTVTDVALGLGFAHPAHFSTAFTQHFGVPPSHCRPS